jgi:hypothetical protein
MQDQQREMETVKLAIFRGELTNGQQNLYQYFLETDGHLNTYAPQVLGGGFSGSDEAEAPLSLGQQKLQLRWWQVRELNDVVHMSSAYLHAPATQVLSSPAWQCVHLGGLAALDVSRPALVA